MEEFILLEKRLKEIGYYLTKYNDSFTLTRFKNGEVILDFFCDDFIDIKKELIKDIKYNIKLINNENNNLEKYKKELNNILLKIKNSL